MNGWAGSIAFGPSWLLYSGMVGPTAPHAHHADQIIVSAASAPLDVEARDQQMRGSVVRIPSDVRHSILRGAEFADVLFVEPNGRTTALDARVHSLDSPQSITTWESALDRAESIIRVASSAEPAATNAFDHPAVSSALSRLPELVANGPVSVRHLAELVGLSPSRLSHLFVRQTGIPIRSHVRWARLRIATESLARDQTLTAAAHTAGFSDSSHFSRTFRSMFGLSPTDVFAGSTFLSPN